MLQSQLIHPGAHKSETNMLLSPPAAVGSCLSCRGHVAAETTESNLLNRSIVEASTDCITILSNTGELLYMNEAGRVGLELDAQSVFYGRLWADLWPGRARGLVRRAVQQAAAGEVARFSAQSPTAKGSQKWWDVVISPARSSPSGALVCISRDMTDHKVAEYQVRWAANHDSLTDLANRSLFRNVVEQAVTTVQSGGGGLALLLLDLDDFKRVNDTLGHDTGDALLRTFAKRLSEATPTADCVARLGGDEFAILLGGVSSAEQLNEAIGLLFEKLREPWVHDGRILDFHTSIGGCLYPLQAAGRAELMKNADVALYAAKEAGGGTYRLFEPEFRAEVQRHRSMISIARDALNRNLIVPHYQPKIDLRTGRLYGFEALLRWMHPKRGLQAPATIEAAFDDFSLAAAISDTMISQVLLDIREWLDRGLAFGHVAINAAAAEFKRGNFAERVLEQMHQHHIPSNRLQVEVTEKVFLGRGAEYVERALRMLSEAGVEIALDDFGTGFASLSHLKKFPVDVIKIDRSFIKSLDADAEDEAIVRAVIGLGKSLDIRIVAEGVETYAQSAYLRKLNCEYGQGFLFGAAAPAGRVAALIERSDRRWTGQSQVTREAAVQPSESGLLMPRDAADAGWTSDSHIYIVDDEEDLCRATALLLSAWGYRCRTFASGAEFLKQVPELVPGCILLDMRMSGLTGLQVLSELRWSGIGWPAIAMSGEGGASVEDALALGASAFLTKPFREEEVVEAFKRGFAMLQAECGSLAEAA